MLKLVNKIFQRYGVDIKVQSGTTTYTVRGFVQPRSVSAKKDLMPEYTPLGHLSQGYYRILLPAYEARVDQLLMYNGRWYIVRRVERVWLKEKAIYDWCWCEERGVTDQWGL